MYYYNKIQKMREKIKKRENFSSDKNHFIKNAHFKRKLKKNLNRKNMFMSNKIPCIIKLLCLQIKQLKLSNNKNQKNVLNSSLNQSLLCGDGMI